MTSCMLETLRKPADETGAPAKLRAYFLERAALVDLDRSTQRRLAWRDDLTVGSSLDPRYSKPKGWTSQGALSHWAARRAFLPTDRCLEVGPSLVESASGQPGAPVVLSGSS